MERTRPPTPSRTADQSETTLVLSFAGSTDGMSGESDTSPTVTRR